MSASTTLLIILGPYVLHESLVAVVPGGTGPDSHLPESGLGEREQTAEPRYLVGTEQVPEPDSLSSLSSAFSHINSPLDTPHLRPVDESTVRDTRPGHRGDLGGAVVVVDRPPSPTTDGSVVDTVLSEGGSRVGVGRDDPGYPLLSI